jgi:2-phosphosulfolactate phosphatase
MKLEVYFTPLGLTHRDVAGKPVLVLDVLRTTTTIVAALGNGARAVVPTPTAEEALRVANSLEPNNVLLAGERGCLRVEGFALGNSPAEMSGDAIVGKTIVMSTTNGTVAFEAVDAAGPVLVGAATNFTAAVERARAILEERGELIVLCSGREKRFALEDAYAAGRFGQALIPARLRRSTNLNDAAIAALQLVGRYGDRWMHAFQASAAAKQLSRLGFKDDVIAAAEVDAHDIVPLYAKRLVSVPSGR